MKDTEDCPKDVTRANMSMTELEMCTSLTRLISDRIADEYNCLHDSVPTNPKKLAKELSKIKNKLKITKLLLTSKHLVRSDLPMTSVPPTKTNNIGKKSATDGLVAHIHRKAKLHRDIVISCALCDKYGGAVKLHTTSACKRWTGASQDHPK